MAAELLGREQWANKETVAHIKTVEKVHLAKAELEDARTKLLEVTHKVATLEASDGEL